MFISELFDNDDINEDWKSVAKKLAAGALTGALAVSPAHAKGGGGGGHGGGSHGSSSHSSFGGEHSSSVSTSRPVAPKGSNLGKARFNPDTGEYEVMQSPRSITHASSGCQYEPDGTPGPGCIHDRDRIRKQVDIRNKKFNPDTHDFD